MEVVATRAGDGGMHRTLLGKAGVTCNLLRTYSHPPPPNETVAVLANIAQYGTELVKYIPAIVQYGTGIVKSQLLCNTQYILCNVCTFIR